MTTAVPPVRPPAWIFIFLIIACLAGWLFSGCVSIKTHERAKIESYEQGNIDMANRFIQTIESGATQEEVLFDLKGILDVKEMKK